MKAQYDDHSINKVKANKMNTVDRQMIVWNEDESMMTDRCKGSDDRLTSDDAVSW